MNYQQIKKQYLLNAIDFEKSNYKLSVIVKNKMKGIMSLIEGFIDSNTNKDGSMKITESELKGGILAVYDAAILNANKDIIAEMVSISNIEYNKNSLLIKASVIDKVSSGFKDTYIEKVVFNEQILRKNKFFMVEFTKYEKELKKSILGRVSKALVKGKTFEVASNKIFKDLKGDTTLTMANVKSISRTMMKNIQNEAVSESFKDNDIKYVKLLAILDSRTTDVCSSLNNKVFRIKDAPPLPLHFNCRSTLIHVSPWDLKEAKKDLISFKEWYSQNRNDPDLARISYVF